MILVPLTDREEEVCALIAKGSPRKKVAQSLGITEGTVNWHCDNISEKLDGPGRFAVRVTRYWLVARSTEFPMS